jgi:hypothetical protein
MIDSHLFSWHDVRNEVFVSMRWSIRWTRYYENELFFVVFPVRFSGSQFFLSIVVIKSRRLISVFQVRQLIQQFNHNFHSFLLMGFVYMFFEKVPSPASCHGRISEIYLVGGKSPSFHVSGGIRLFHRREVH